MQEELMDSMLSQLFRPAPERELSGSQTAPDPALLQRGAVQEVDGRTESRA